MDRHATTLFLMRQLSKPGGDNRDEMSHLFELGGDMRAGIPGAAANRWILTVKDKDSHART